MGNQIKIPRILKKKCTRAIASPAPLPVSAAKRAVVVVPILAPKVTGKIEARVRSPEPAIGTSSDVVIELDWTQNVRTPPNKMAV